MQHCSKMHCPFLVSGYYRRQTLCVYVFQSGLTGVNFSVKSTITSCLKYNERKCINQFEQMDQEIMKLCKKVQEFSEKRQNIFCQQKHMKFAKLRPLWKRLGFSIVNLTPPRLTVQKRHSKTLVILQGSPKLSKQFLAWLMSSSSFQKSFGVIWDHLESFKSWGNKISYTIKMQRCSKMSCPFSFSQYYRRQI